MFVNDTPTASVVGDLVQTLEDGREGFQLVAEKLDDDGRPDLAGVMREFSEERAGFSAQLREAALGHGLEIDEDGSVVGALHRGWIALKDALSGSDLLAVLAAAETGEDHAVQEYEHALQREDLPEDLRRVIGEQAERVRSAHDQVRDFRDQIR